MDDFTILGQLDVSGQTRDSLELSLSSFLLTPFGPHQLTERKKLPSTEADALICTALRPFLPELPDILNLFFPIDTLGRPLAPPNHGPAPSQ